MAVDGPIHRAGLRRITRGHPPDRGARVWRYRAAAHTRLRYNRAGDDLGMCIDNETSDRHEAIAGRHVLPLLNRQATTFHGVVAQGSVDQPFLGPWTNCLSRVGILYPQYRSQSVAFDSRTPQIAPVRRRRLLQMIVIDREAGRSLGCQKTSCRPAATRCIHLAQGSHP